MEIKTSEKIYSIEYLRGIAAIMVTYFHLTGSSNLSESIKVSGKYGFLGVEIFFVISGFIIPYSLYRNNYSIGNFFSFIAKRIVRIDPPYIAIIVITLVLMIITGRSLPKVADIVFHLGYLNGLLGFEWISPVFWTLALEFQFYLIIGLLFQLLNNESHLWFLVVIFSLISLSFFTSKNTIFPYFCMFSIGLILFRKKVHNLSDLYFYPVFVLLFILIFWFNGVAEALACIFAGIFILLNKEIKNGKARSLLLWFGSISYSLYLTHWELGRTVIAVFRHTPILGEIEILRLLFGFLFSILTAWLLNKFIEQPFISVSKRIKY
ncbi:MAG: acyltransferase [Bacteroidetes bacterium]|nr:MAG: acyltransferase [Bacteroidota bacterium]